MLFPYDRAAPPHATGLLHALSLAPARKSDALFETKGLTRAGEAEKHVARAEEFIAAVKALLGTAPGPASAL